MMKRVKASEIFAANAVTKLAIRAEVIGRYVPTGPNKWDDLELDRGLGGDAVDVPSESRVQVEPIGADPEVRFRLRRGKDVLICRWLLTAEDEKEVASGKWGVQESEQASRIERILGLVPKNDPRDDMHEYFLDVIADPIH